MKAAWLAAGLAAGVAIGLVVPLAAQQSMGGPVMLWGVPPAQTKIVVCIDLTGNVRNGTPMTKSDFGVHGTQLSCPS